MFLISQQNARHQNLPAVHCGFQYCVSLQRSEATIAICSYLNAIKQGVSSNQMTNNSSILCIQLSETPELFTQYTLKSLA